MNNVIIHGIPYEEGENLKSKILKITDKIEVKLEDYDDIKAVHRLHIRNNAATVIMKLNN